jgi:hypothetical protein
MADVVTAPEELTWDIAAEDGGPRRPSLEDLGNATLEDDAKEPPDPETMPYAAQLNQWAKQLEALAAVVPFVAFSVEFSGGAPAVVAVTCPRRSGVDLDTFTPTDNADGDTTITWPAGTFPPPLLRPFVVLNGNPSVRTTIAAEAVANGVRVRSRGATDALVDNNFSVLYI